MSTWVGIDAYPAGTIDWALEASLPLSYDEFWLELDPRSKRGTLIPGIGTVLHLYEALHEGRKQVDIRFWYEPHEDPYALALIGGNLTLRRESWKRYDNRPIRCSRADEVAASARVVADLVISARHKLEPMLQGALNRYAAFYAAWQPGEEHIFQLV